ncbi:MAG: hypothetical protein ACYCQJ_12500 [Nitrososphaerales archaeon]
MVLLVREHMCWCDSLVCGCLHETYDTVTKVRKLARVQPNMNYVWSRASSTYASYIKEPYIVWNPEDEADLRDLGTAFAARAPSATLK